MSVSKASKATAKRQQSYYRQIYAALVENLFDKPGRLDASSFAKRFTEGEIISMIGQAEAML